MTRKWAQQLAPSVWVVTEEDRRLNRRLERRLGIAQMDEHAMEEWRQQFPQDVLDEHASSAQRRAKRRRSKSPIVRIDVRGSKPHSSI
ncbi:Farnesyl pyrophosphate synthetase [Hordeum vulgare]|nr:Farnesyl pyrophosphate synthetase [Hordeum vulgare]